jgi:DNA-binding CsgD family transcriptional regulator
MNYLPTMTRPSPEDRGPEHGQRPCAASGVLLLSVNHDILYVSSDGFGILQQLHQFEDEYPPSMTLPQSVQQICLELDNARCERTTPVEWASIQLQRTTGPASTPVTLRGFVIPEWGTPLTCRLLILFEAHQAAPPITDGIKETLPLTERQQAIAKGLIRGLTNKELANELHISAHTVKEYVRVIMGKVQASTRAGVVARLSGAYQMDLTPMVAHSKAGRHPASGHKALS